MMTVAPMEDKARSAAGLLVDRYFRELDSEENRDRKVVYLFTSGGVSELFRVFDFRIVMPEMNAIHCARRNLSVDLIHAGEDLGYSEGVCSYVKSDLGLMLGPTKGCAPFGKIPPPDLIVITHGGCSTYIKWAEALSREFGCPVRMIDVPFVREEGATEFDRAYVLGQIRELIPDCEKISGTRFDIDKLGEILKLTAQTVELWIKLLDYGKKRPSPLDGFFEAVFYMSPMTLWRGTKEAVSYYELAVEQMENRAKTRFSPVQVEKFRLLFEGSPPWPRFGEFGEMFWQWGAVAAASTYVRLGCACEGLEMGPENPMEFLAYLAGLSYYNWSYGKKVRFLEKLAKEYDVDAIIANSVRSCRPVSIGLLDLRNHFAREMGIPTLFLESDIADPSYFSSVQILDRVNTFLQGLTERKKGRPRRQKA